ncbi:MAG: hypothetical protein V1859_03660 [archaeon]
MKFQFISSIIFALLLVYMATNESFNARIILLIPLLVLFYLSIILFGIEFDRQCSNVIKSKVEHAKKEAYESFVRENHKKSN